MSTAYNVPFRTSVPQKFLLTFPSGAQYTMNFYFLFNVLNPCWVLDISDALGAPLVSGIALVPGGDLLQQFAYLAFGCALYASTPGDTTRPIAWNGLVTGSVQIVT